MNKQETETLYKYKWLEKIPEYKTNMKISLDGMNADEYIAQLIEEMNKIDLCSIPIDKWDLIVTFSLAMLEVAGDFFICDPKFKPSLANKLSDKNSALGSWMNDQHENFNHSLQPLDFQGVGFGGGDHRGHSLGHDLIMFPLALYMLSQGTFVDNTFSKDGVYNWIISQTNQHGNEYATMNVDEAIIAYFTHMLADFCSSRSLPIPGFSILTHFPNRDVQAFSKKLYRDGLNIRNLLLQGIPVAITELGMWLYLGLRYKDSEYTPEAIRRKREKLLLIAHGIATSVNIGKVIITKNPVSLNLVMIARTFTLVWKVIIDEIKLTNQAVLKLEMGVLKARIESTQTLVLLDKTMYLMDQIDSLIEEQKEVINRNRANMHESLSQFDNDFESIRNQF